MSPVATVNSIIYNFTEITCSPDGRQARSATIRYNRTADWQGIGIVAICTTVKF